MANILIIDDEEGVRYTLSAIVKGEGHEPSCAHNMKSGLEAALSGSFDVVFLDVMMPDGSGLDLLPEILKTVSQPEVIIITALGNPEGAELALKNGAWDYLQKPFAPQTIILLLKRALQFREARKEKKPFQLLSRGKIIGNSPQIRSSLELVGQAAQSDVTVLLTGEPGTGKELFAQAIHNNSSRYNKGFIVVDCAALPETLVESVLFGYEKGAFTGADRPHEGLIQLADGGTLFLDEVGELHLSIQKIFLRVLQEHRFRSVGGKNEIRSNFRLVVATNRDLDQMVESGHFRRDLWHRLQSMVIHLPPLRERKSDLRELAMHFMNKFCDRNNKATRGFSPEFLEALAAYDWPGNVRELENSLNSTLTTAGEDPILFPKHLPLHIRVKVTQDSIRKEVQNLPKPMEGQDAGQTIVRLKDYRENVFLEAEKKYLQNLISFTRGNIEKACQLSGLSQSHLYALLKRHKKSGSSPN
jgi:two-component system, NtrC family, response regulator